MKGKDTFENDFIAFADVIEKIIVTAIYTLLAGLIVAQSLLQHHALRNGMTKVDKLEGIRYESAAKQ